MEFKPNSISQTDAKAIVMKFKEHNKGIMLGAGSRYTSHILGSRDYDAHSAKWSDLISEGKYTVDDIRQKMLEIAAIINGLPQDDVLGDTSVYFHFRDNKNKRIAVKWEDAYIFLREALRERKETKEYQSKVKERAKLKEYIDKNKPQDQKLKEAQELYDKLSSEIGSEDNDDVQVNSPASTASAN